MQYEVFDAPFKFYDSDKVKCRPILSINKSSILEMKGLETITAIKITEHSPRKGKYIEYQLQYWKYCGLDCESTVRLSSLYQDIRVDNLKYKRGNLHYKDIVEIQILMRKHAKKMGIYS